MRIVQVIDSLEIGGAERMAVNYANALSQKIEFSGLVATRKEGALKQQLDKKVDYFFLAKKRSVDIGAVLRLRKYFRDNNVGFVQPHSSSYFVVFLVKLLYPKINIIWHDHNGLSEFISSQKTTVIKIASRFFKGIIVVNYQLKAWALRELHCANVIYLPNFTAVASDFTSGTALHGQPGKRILCLANLRDQKDHFFLLDIASKLKNSHPDWTFHLVGKDFHDGYSERLRRRIGDDRLSENVFLYGSRNDTPFIIGQSDIAILTSKSEGLPVALLEYGLAKKPVVATEVGEIPLILKEAKNGFIVPKGNAAKFHENLVSLIESEHRRQEMGEALYRTVAEQHSEEAVLAHYLKWLENH